jgi:AraC-like DNA-binding protein
MIAGTAIATVRNVLGGCTAAMRSASVSAGFANGLLAYAESRGADRAVVCGRSGIASAWLADPDARVPFSAYVAAMRAAQDLTGDRALALHFGEGIGIEAVSIVGLIGQASETMLDALAQLNRYVPLVVDVPLDLQGDTGGTGSGPGRERPVRFDLVQRQDGLWVVDRRAAPEAFPELTESAFAQLVCGPRRLGVPPFVLEVHVTHPAPAYRDEYARVFGAPVRFGAEWNALRIDEAVAGHRVGALPRYVFSVLTGHADALLARLDGSATARSRVERIALPILHTGEVGVEAVARRLGVSRQTLYRQLRAEGVTFEQVRDELRHELAAMYLGDSRLPVHEIGYLVGYSDPAAFSRAFRRWSGTSPRGARAAARAGR